MVRQGNNAIYRFEMWWNEIKYPVSHLMLFIRFDAMWCDGWLDKCKRNAALQWSVSTLFNALWKIAIYTIVWVICLRAQINYAVDWWWWCILSGKTHRHLYTHCLLRVITLKTRFYARRLIPNRKKINQNKKRRDNTNDGKVERWS